jgi:hypothetical protein
MTGKSEFAERVKNSNGLVSRTFHSGSEPIVIPDLPAGLVPHPPDCMIRTIFTIRVGLVCTAIPVRRSPSAG